MVAVHFIRETDMIGKRMTTNCGMIGWHSGGIEYSTTQGYIIEAVPPPYEDKVTCKRCCQTIAAAMPPTTQHGSKELDEDAAKLAAMGADPGPTLADIGHPGKMASDQDPFDLSFVKIDAPINLPPGAYEARIVRDSKTMLITRMEIVQPKPNAPRPGKPREAKVTVTTRIDADVLRWFKDSGPGWQTRMNEALRLWMERYNIIHEEM